jgi:hypothetical protein
LIQALLFQSFHLKVCSPALFRRILPPQGIIIPCYYQLISIPIFFPDRLSRRPTHYLFVSGFSRSTSLPGASSHMPCNNTSLLTYGTSHSMYHRPYKRKTTRTTDAEGRIIRRRVKSKDMMKKNFLS